MGEEQDDEAEKDKPTVVKGVETSEALADDLPALGVGEEQSAKTRRSKPENVVEEEDEE